MIGVLVALEEVFAGGVTRDAHTAGETVLRLADATDFTEAGGQLQVGDVVYDYTAADLDVDELTLTAGLSAAVEADAAVRVHPQSPTRVAMVLTEGDPHPIPARVPTALLGQLELGVRSTGGEQLVSVEVLDGRATVTDVHGQEPGAMYGYADKRHILIRDGAIWAMKPADAEGEAAQPTIAFGNVPGGSLLQVHDEDSGVTGRWGPDGTLQAGVGDFQQVLVDGVDVLQQLTTGTQIITYEEYTGPVGHYNGRFGIYELAWSPLPNRTYIIECYGRYRTAGGAPYVLVNMAYRATVDGSTPPDPLVTSGTLSASAIPLMYSGVGNYAFSGPVKFRYRTTQAGARVRTLLWMEPSTTGGDMTAQAAVWTFIIWDTGYDASDPVGQPSLGGGGNVGSPVAPPTTPPLRTVTSQWYDVPVPHSTWTPQYGRNTAYRPSWVRAGRGGGSDYRSYLWIPSELRSWVAALDSGLWVELFLSVAEVGSGTVRPYIGTSTATSMSTEPGSGNFAQSARGYSWSAKSGPFRLESAAANAVFAGATMIAVGDKNNGRPLVSFHGPSAASGSRPRIRVSGKRRG